MININAKQARQIRLLAWIVFLLCAAFFAWKLYSSRTPEAKIKRTLLSLCEAASKAEGDGTTSLVLKTRAINELFAPETSLDLKPSTFNGSYTPEEISSNMVRYRALFTSVKVEMKDIYVTVLSDTGATAEATASLDGRTKGGEWVNEVRDIVCDLTLIDDTWKVSGIRIREILEK